MVSLAGRDAATAVVQRQIDGDLCLLRAIVGDFEARREVSGLPDLVGGFRSCERFTVLAFVE